ncbi:MAG: hypothetical protein KAR05_06630 [Candidatus Omnitrophica bacterium]|nr:hypothetical protein [Candidatus Omnitrophota bacterium]
MMDPSYSFNISIAGICVSFHCANKIFFQILKNKYASFENAATNKEIIVIEILERPFDKNFDEIILEEKEGCYFLRSEDFNAEICLNTKKVKLESRLEITVFNTFLRILYSLLAVQHRGFLLHAAGLIYNKQGYVFSGPSSSGKTTTARRATNLSVLNDELTLIRKIGNDYRVHATPFTGEYEGSISVKSAPLQYLLFLNKELQTGHQPVDKLTVIVKLMENIFFFDKNLSVNQLLLDNCRELTENTPGFEVNIFASNSIEEVIDGIGKNKIFSEPQNSLATNR